MAYERLDKTYTDGQIWDEKAVSRIDDAIESLDKVLNVRQFDIIKHRQSTNLFDKNAYEFDNDFYVANRINNKAFSDSGTYGGGGWKNIPVEAGKSYVLCINNTVTLTDMNNTEYGVFMNTWFLDADKKVVMCAPYSANNQYYYYAYTDGVRDEIALGEVAYNTRKATISNYDGSTTYRTGTNCIIITIKDESIKYINVQIGVPAWGGFQINNDFNTRGHLTETEIATIVNSFQINEGTELLPYEEYWYEEYTEIGVESELTRIENTFTKEKILSTNILQPTWFLNHVYMQYNKSLNVGDDGNYKFEADNYKRGAMLQIPVSVGNYVLCANDLQTVGNKQFGYFGQVYFVNALGNIVTYKSAVAGNPYFIKYPDFLNDPTKADATGYGTNTLKISILDESITEMYVVLQDNDKNSYGLWLNYENENGLTDVEMSSLLYNMQLNVGSNVLPYEAWDADKGYQRFLKAEYVEGLTTFKEDIAASVEELVSSAVSKEVNMVCTIEENDLLIRCKQWEADKDLVWYCHKISPSASSNKYFNFDSINTCPHTTPDEEYPILTSWKGASDDLFPSQIYGSYIGGNHGFYCVNKITATAHGKTEADIGSVWTCSEKTYCLVKVIDENTLWMVWFNDTMMSNGYMKMGSPSGTMTHTSGATNTADIVIESQTGTQLWKCQNKYSIKLFVDGIEQDLFTNGYYTGDKIEILTQYNVIYVPAMLNYLMANVGNNTNDSQCSEEIDDYYFTVYINYQFNRNGSVSTYSSYYANRDILYGTFGLVQSMQIGKYGYIPDTKNYEVLTSQEDKSYLNFAKEDWKAEDKIPYRYYQFNNLETSYTKGMALIYDRSIGYGDNTKRLQYCDDAGHFNGTTRKMYPNLVNRVTMTPGMLIDGMAARVPLYKYDPDLTSIGWYWCSDDIILMIDTHASVNKDIVLPDYMNNYRVEILDKTDSCNVAQTYIFNNKLRFQCTDYGYAVLRLYK